MFVIFWGVEGKEKKQVAGSLVSVFRVNADSIGLMPMKEEKPHLLHTFISGSKLDI